MTDRVVNRGSGTPAREHDYHPMCATLLSEKTAPQSVESDK